MAPRLSMKSSLAILLSVLCPSFAHAAFIFTTFDAPNSVSTLAGQINNAGQVAGEYQDASGLSHGFIRNVDGTFVIFNVPGSGSAPVMLSTSGYGINNSGVVSGNYFDASLGKFQGFIRDSGGTFVKFD